ncbi:MAG: hypothetical protein ABIK13_00250 [Patescibacteria group bacterium]
MTISSRRRSTDRRNRGTDRDAVFLVLGQPREDVNPYRTPRVRPPRSVVGRILLRQGKLEAIDIEPPLDRLELDCILRRIERDGVLGEECVENPDGTTTLFTVFLRPDDRRYISFFPHMVHMLLQRSANANHWFRIELDRTAANAERDLAA